jgi:protease-4
LRPSFACIGKGIPPTLTYLMMIWKAYMADQYPQNPPHSAAGQVPPQGDRPINPPQQAQAPRPAYQYPPQYAPQPGQTNPGYPGGGVPQQGFPGGQRPPMMAQPPQYAPQQYTPQQFAPQQGFPPMGQTGFGAQPPNAPAPKQIKRSPLPMIIGICLLIGFGLFSLIALITGISASGGGTSGGGMFAFGDKIAVLELDGALGAGPMYTADTERLRNLVRDWRENDKIKGMIIRVNSPGGAVSATQDLFYEIEQFRATGRPVYTSMGDIAASGGYYVAMASDKVYVNSGTLTGSIGVILSLMGYQELFNKIGLESRVIKSGEFKDIGSGSRPLTEAEKTLLNDMIKDVFEQFFEVVLDSRKEVVREVLASKESQATGTTVTAASITDEQVEAHLRKYCDGRIFSGRQAIEYGMADAEGTFEQALKDMRTNLGLDEQSPVVFTPKPQESLFGFFDRQMNAVQSMSPGTVLLEFRFTL